jgi:FeS assembly SUF system protein
LIIDDDKTLFDFLPGKPAPADDDPFETPVADDGDPALKEAVLEALKTVRDPEIPVNLVDLGLIYDLSVGSDGKVFVEMTLTSPSCPVAGSLPGDVENAVRGVAGVSDVRVRLSWTPPWHQDLMSEEAKLELGLL